MIINNGGLEFVYANGLIMEDASRKKRIFIPPEDIAKSPVVLTGSIHQHVHRVLRARAGDEFCAVAGDGFEYKVKIDSIQKDRTICWVLEKVEKNVETPVRIVMYLGMLKSGGIEEVIPAMVHVGVSEIYPVITERSENRTRKYSSAKMDRFRSMVHRATTLSHRTRLMEVRQPITFEHALMDCTHNIWNILFWEEEDPVPLRTVVENIPGLPGGPGEPTAREASPNGSKSLGLFIGPEGGFTREEAEKAREQGIYLASLGPRVLSSKIAPISAVSAVLYEMGSM